MATAMHVTDASPTRRRQEIEEWHSSLATRTDTESLGVPTGATRARAAGAPQEGLQSSKPGLSPDRRRPDEGTDGA
jgi:hypothetical protein